MRKGTNVGVELRKGAWTAEEDMLLKKCIEKHGEGKWHLVPLKAGLNRCRKSCRLRWLNYLRPNIKRGDFAEDEVDLILRLHKLLGNRWSLIAGRIPGRTANAVKNYWNTHLRSGSNSKQRKKESNNELIQDNRVTIIKPQPRTFSKTQDSYVGDKACINVSSGIFSSPNTLDNTIDKYLDDLFDDREMETNGEVGWSFGSSSMEGMGLTVVEEEEDDHISLFDFPMDEAMLDVINSYQL